MIKMKVLSVIIFVSSVSGSLWANSAEATKDERSKMAEMHSKMASCLQSDQPISECQSEMSKSCKIMMNNEACMMMSMNHNKMHKTKVK